jgi:hypothetical protein
MIHSSSASEKAKVFEYINRVFHRLTDVRTLNAFMKHLLMNIRDLITINADRVSDLLDSYPEEDFKEAIFKLGEFPQTKFKLLQKIVSKKRKAAENIEDRLMIDYFELTCRLTPERVCHINNIYEQAQQELKFGDFPQNECLEICRKYAYIYTLFEIQDPTGRGIPHGEERVCD